MTRTGYALTLACLLLATPVASFADNSLLIPASGRCALEASDEQLADAIADCKQRAQSGDTGAQFELGEFYYSGKRTTQDFGQALYFFEQASLKGHAAAQHRLGSMYFNGQGVPANALQAFIVLKMAAVNGDESALDTADHVEANMPVEQHRVALQILGQLFRGYMQSVQDSFVDEPPAL